MKTIILKEIGSVDMLELKDLPTPSIMDNEVLVEVKAISVNPVDTKVRSGDAFDEIFRAFNPIVLGWDISGVIIELGSAVKNFKLGDEVFGMVNFPKHGKAYAEYVAAPAAHLALKPRNTPYTDAAAATLAPLTVWQAFTKNAQIKEGDRVLIHAAAGGVGHYAVQMAKHLGAYVIGTSSAANKKIVLSLGADEHIDYRSQKFEEAVKDVDFVLDTIGGDNFIRSLEVLKKSGTIVSLPLELTQEAKKAAEAKGLKKGAYFFMLVESSGDDMKEIANLLEKNIIKSHISKTYPLEEMAQAHLDIETGHTVGKIVVTV